MPFSFKLDSPKQSPQNDNMITSDPNSDDSRGMGNLRPDGVDHPNYIARVDLETYEMALKDPKWHLPDAQDIIDRVQKLAKTTKSATVLVRCARIMLAAKAQNIDMDRKPAPEQHLHIHGTPEDHVDDMLGRLNSQIEGPANGDDAK